MSTQSGATSGDFGEAEYAPRRANKAAVRELLRRVPFLADYSKTEVLEVLTESTDLIRFAAGEVLSRQSEEAQALYWVFQGRLHVVRTANVGGVEVPIVERTVDTSTLVGRYALIYNLPYTSTVTAQSDVLALRFPASALERLLYRFPALRPQIIPQDLINRLRTLPLFRDVGTITLSYLAEEIRTVQTERDQVLYTQTTAADDLYLIHKGQILLFHPRIPTERTWLGTGGAFGFPGSIGPDGGDATTYGHWAQATAPTTLYVLAWSTVRRVARRFPQMIDVTLQERPSQTIAQVPVFAEFSPQQKRKLAGFCSFQAIPQHHLIMQQGDIGDSMWILLEGSKATLSALDANERALPRTSVAGVIYFGETALRAARNVRSTVEAEPGSLWLRLHWQDFRRFLEEEGADLRQKLRIQLPEEELPEEEVMTAKNKAQTYDWLGEGEVLISITRRHWMALLEKLRFSLAVLILAVSLLVGVAVLQVGLWTVLVLSGIMLVLTTAWGLIDYWNDYFIVTNQRIIQQEKVILANEYRREALLDQIENIDVQTSFWGNVFGYGLLQVYTAGASGAITFNMVREPKTLKATIFRERDLRIMRYKAETKLRIQDTLEQRLGVTMELPSRVHSSNANKQEKQASLNPWRKFWRTLVGENHLSWTASDRVVWHKHWFILLRQILTPLILLILLIGLIVVTSITSVTFGWWEAFHSYIVWGEILLVFVGLILLLVVVYQFADWWNDTYEITRDRIVDVEKLPLFLSEKRREAQLSQIQDVTYTISSPLEMLLNYGDVVVQTAASQGAFTFLHVPNPRQVKEEITRRLVEWRRQDELRKARERLSDLPDWFELYNRLESGQQSARRLQENEEPPLT